MFKTKRVLSLLAAMMLASAFSAPSFAGQAPTLTKVVPWFTDINSGG